MAKRGEAAMNYSHGTDPFLQVGTEVREERKCIMGMTGKAVSRERCPPSRTPPPSTPRAPIFHPRAVVSQFSPNGKQAERSAEEHLQRLVLRRFRGERSSN